ncbi:MAG TPA: HAD family hydrolase [Bryobacteraceae bacterium]|nr:HAD family hydrolase [Bryobacteraceae bacterium]
MPKAPSISWLFCDIGGVLLTDGWNHRSRKLAAKHFGYDWAETEERHRLAFDAYELGKTTLDDYLGSVYFDRKRSFTRAAFRRFMLEQSRPLPDMLALVRRLKARHGLRIAVVSNEGRELNHYRIRKFKLNAMVDCFVSSSFVRLRKPDPEIFRLALDLTQAPRDQVVYIENTAMFAQLGESLGIRTILHKDCESTRAKLAELGLTG